MFWFVQQILMRQEIFSVKEAPKKLKQKKILTIDSSDWITDVKLLTSYQSSNVHFHKLEHFWRRTQWLRHNILNDIPTKPPTDPRLFIRFLWSLFKITYRITFLVPLLVIKASQFYSHLEDSSLKSRLYYSRQRLKYTHIDATTKK